MTKEVHHMHSCPTETRKFVIEDLQDKYGLKGWPLALFTFYALHCKDGFTPSEAFIERETGISSGHVSDVRKMLSDMRFITVTATQVILDWEQLIDLARIDKSMIGKTQAVRRAGIRDPKEYYNYVSLKPEWKTMYDLFREEGDAVLKERDSALTWLDLCKEAQNDIHEVTYDEIIYKASANHEVMKQFLNGAIQFPDRPEDRCDYAKFKPELLENPDWPEEDFEPVPF